MRTMISNPIREILNHNIEYKNELDKYRNNQLVQDVYSLIIDYPLYYKWIRLNIIFLKLLKKIFSPK